MKFYSQIGQDEKLISRLNNKRNGFFVDIGANDGTIFSNSKTLEESLDWDGICIEANIKPYKVCAETRKSTTLNLAVYNHKGVVTFSSGADSLVGGVKDSFDPLHEECWGKINKFEEWRVCCDTLFNVLKDNNAPEYIDYLSMDTEGSELLILEKFFQENNGKYKFKYMDLEHNHNQVKIKRITRLLEDNGYKFLCQNQWDFTFELEKS